MPQGYTVQGGMGPSGWTITNITASATVTFEVVSCKVGGIGSGSSGSFTVNVTPPSSPLSQDTSDALADLTPSDPCGGTGGWTKTKASSVTFARKVLLVTGSVSPSQGLPPLAEIVTYTVKNLSSAQQSGIVLAPAVTPSLGVSSSGCSPASLSLAAGASSTVTCAYSLSTAQTYLFQATASTSGASAVGASAGSVEVGLATATFTLDVLNGGPGDLVHATLTVTNNGSSAITATPPRYVALTLTGLTSAAGTHDPGSATIAARSSHSFIYSMNVSGAVGASYLAKGTASTTVGATNLAVTPPGTVSASLVNLTPPAVVKTRVSSPYVFTVTVVNRSIAAVSEVDIVNPQSTLWTGFANEGTSSPLAYKSSTTSGSTVTLRYTGTLASGATATIHFQFTGVPTVAQTTAYPFQVTVVPSGGGQYSASYGVSVSVAVPITDVAGLTLLSNATGQTLSWSNTGRSDAPHDGVVVFRTLAPAVPQLPADYVDYTVTADQPSDFFYADNDASSLSALADPAVGTYNYRVCNHDALLVYSACNTGFWNGAGWIDSTPAPSGGWAQQVGGAALLLPGIVPGNRVGIASNVPSVTILDLASGSLSVDPIVLSALPSNNTPAAPLEDGSLYLFAADQGGMVTAFDLNAGTLAWQTTKTGESFVAGVSGILRSYAASAFQAAYAQDVLLLPSTTGRLFALDAATGSTLWTVSTGATGGLRANVFYDSSNNRLFVPANGGGLFSYDLSTSSSLSPPALAAGFVNPGGTYRLGCNRGISANELACVDTSGNLSLVNELTGSLIASVATSAASPSSLWTVGGTSGGFVVGNASRVVRVDATLTPPAMTIGGNWAPSGVTLSPLQVFVSDGTIYVGGSDKKIHKLNLANATDTGLTASINPEASSVLVGPPGFDVVNNVFVFGTDDGHVWAVPYF